MHKKERFRSNTSEEAANISETAGAGPTPERSLKQPAVRCTPAGYYLLQLTSGWWGGEGGEWRGLHLGKPFEEEILIS